MALTEQEFYAALEEHPEIGVAFANAIKVCSESWRTPHGLLSWLRQARRQFEFNNAIRRLLEIYGSATGVRRPISDFDVLVAIVEREARSPVAKMAELVRRLSEMEILA